MMAKKSTLSLQQRIGFLKSMPLFAHCQITALEVLAKLLTDIQFASQDIIVRENDSINAVYIIVSGKAQVSSHTLSGTAQVIATLYPGEAIGLDAFGFYSKTSARTATVSAITTLEALQLNISMLNDFLAENPGVIPNHEQTLHEIRCFHFIKNLEPFAQISPQTLQAIAPYITEIKVPAQSILLQQGNKGDVCYCLIEGTVDVLVKSPDEEERVIATLAEGALIGELALLMDTPRNATIKTMTACTLLQIPREHFQTLVSEVSRHDLNVVTRMIMDRYRPEQMPGILLHERQNALKDTVFILKNPETGDYFRLPEQGLFVWKLLDGDHSIQEICFLYFLFYKQLVTESIGQLILNLMQHGFIKMPPLSNYIQPPKTTLSMKIKRILTYEYAVNQVDPWITRAYEKIGKIFFTPLALIVMTLIAAIGVGLFYISFISSETTLKITPHAWVLLVLLIPVNGFSVVIHELAHALTTKYYGYEVHRLGIGWYWIGPIAFADTSDMWLASRRQRIVVNLAGIYSNLVFAGVMMVLGWCIGNQMIAVFLWLVAFANYLFAFYNLDTLFELDGYYLLMDALDKPNLRQSAIHWLLHHAKETLMQPGLVYQYWREIFYWILSLLFVGLSTCLAYLFQAYVLNAIWHQSIRDMHLWVVPCTTLIASCLSIYSVVKQQARNSQLQSTKR